MSPQIPILAALLLLLSSLPASAAKSVTVAQKAAYLREVAAMIRASDGDFKILTKKKGGKSGEWRETILKRKDALELVYRQLATFEYQQALASGDLSEEKRVRVSASLKSMDGIADAVFEDAKAASVDGAELEESGLMSWGYRIYYRNNAIRTPTAGGAVRGGRKLDSSLDNELNRLGAGVQTAARGIDKAEHYVQMASSVFDDAKAVSVDGEQLEKSANGRYCVWGHCVDFRRRHRVRTPNAVAGVRGGRKLEDGAKLEPGEIYKQAAPSVVVIVCRGEGGGELGTGSIIDAKGRILTNAHVVIPDATGKPFETIRIYFKPDVLTGDPKKDLSNPVTAKVIKADRALDLALLELVEPRSSAPIMPMADTGNIQPGEAVVTIGHPEQGGLWTLTSGVVSTLVADLGGVKGKDVFQTDASINRGNSGGPLIDMHGRMIGVNTSMARRAADGLAITSVNFAIQSNVVTHWLKTGESGIHGKLSSPQTDKPEKVKRGLSKSKTDILTPSAPFNRADIIGMRKSIAESKKKMRESMKEMRRRQKEDMRSFKEGL